MSRIWIAEPGDTSLNRWEAREVFEESGQVVEWNDQKVVLLRPGAQKRDLDSW